MIQLNLWFGKYGFTVLTKAIQCVCKGRQPVIWGTLIDEMQLGLNILADDIYFARPL